eukprot:SAG31_NODE_4266_length_3393_cov_4.735883_5_plen_75_part_00
MMHCRDNNAADDAPDDDDDDTMMMMIWRLNSSYYGRRSTAVNLRSLCSRSFKDVSRTPSVVLAHMKRATSRAAP